MQNLEPIESQMIYVEKEKRTLCLRHLYWEYSKWYQNNWPRLNPNEIRTCLLALV
jgi:hypothetical protein